MRENNLSAILMEQKALRLRTSLASAGGAARRLFAMVLTAKGETFYVCPGLRKAARANRLPKSPDGDNADVRIWQEDENPYKRVAQG